MPFGRHSHGALSHVGRPVQGAWQGYGKVLAMLVVYVQAMTGRMKLLLAPALLVAYARQARSGRSAFTAFGKGRWHGPCCGDGGQCWFGHFAGTAVATSRAIGAAGPVPGTIFVANGGLVGEGTGAGSVTVYRPGASGNTRPEAVITAGVAGPGSLALDSSGNLWVANNLGTVVEYSKAELTGASPAPTVTISSGALDTPGGLTFDASGDLWVGDGGSGRIFEFAKAQLAKSGDPKPEVTLSPDLCSPDFDRSGDLWQGSGVNTLSDLTKAQLTKSGSPAPKVVITSGSLSSPCKPTFDRSGNLWVANYGTTTVVEFTKKELAKSGSPAPKLVITSAAISSPGDVAFDRSGDLWVPSAGKNSVIEFSRAELTKSGSLPPSLSIAGPATGLNCHGPSSSSHSPKGLRCLPTAAVRAPGTQPIRGFPPCSLSAP